MSQLRMRALQPARNAVLAILVLVTFYPFIQMVIISGKSDNQFLYHPLAPTLPWHWENFQMVLAPVLRYFLNTVLVTGISVPGALFLASLSSYVFARHRFPGKNWLFSSLILLLMIPGLLTLVPQVWIVVKMGLSDTYWALILPYIAAHVFDIFVLRAFISTLPEEMYEAARIDGAGHWSLYWRLTIPLCIPVLSTLAILKTLAVWNDFIWPVLVASDYNTRTMAVGLRFVTMQYMGTTAGAVAAPRYGVMMAGYLLGSLPVLVLFAFAMRPFMKGATSAVVKF